MERNKPKSVIIAEDDIYLFGNKKETLSSSVYEQLIEKFINNELAPGQILSRQQIADELNVSAAPVREALLMLEMDGYVETFPQRGTIVKAIREQDVFERLFIREALECTAASYYTGKLIRENKSELLDFALKLDTSKKYTILAYKRELIFHASLVNLAGFPLLTREFIRMFRIGRFQMLNTFTVPEVPDKKGHVELIGKLVASRAEYAGKILQMHIWNGLRLKTRRFSGKLPKNE